MEPSCAEGEEKAVLLEEEASILCWEIDFDQVSPKGVVKALVKLQSSFLWGGNVNKREVHLVKWKKITRSKSQGGLGVRDLGEVNESLLLKWWWKYGNEDSALWKTVVCSRYGRNGGGWLPDLNSSGGISLVWFDIVKLLSENQQLGDFYGEHFRIKVGNGRRILFWQDKWLNNSELKIQFPRLYSLSTEKEETLQQISAKKSNMGLWQL